MKVGDILWQAYVNDHDYGEDSPETAGKISVEIDRYQITRILKGCSADNKRVFLHMLTEFNMVKGKLVTSKSSSWMKQVKYVMKGESIYQGASSFSKTKVAALRHVLSLERKDKGLSKIQMKKVESIVKRAITLSKKKKK